MDPVAGHESPRAIEHWGTAQSNDPQVEEVLGENVVLEHPMHPEHGTHAASYPVSRTMSMS